MEALILRAMATAQELEQRDLVIFIRMLKTARVDAVTASRLQPLLTARMKAEPTETRRKAFAALCADIGLEVDEVPWLSEMLDADPEESVQDSSQRKT